jgi:hypothetical protein
LHPLWTHVTFPLLIAEPYEIEVSFVVVGGA